MSDPYTAKHKLFLISELKSIDEAIKKVKIRSPMPLEHLRYLQRARKDVVEKLRGTE